MTDTDVRRIEDKVDDLRVGLARLEGSLNPTLEKLTTRQDEADVRDRDFEARLRGLERFRYSIPSLSVLGFLVSVASTVYIVLH